LLLLDVIRQAREQSCRGWIVWSTSGKLLQERLLRGSVERSKGQDRLLGLS
jgi:hypothetical protein